MDQPHLLRPVQPPLGLRLRPGHNDHVAISQAVVEGHVDLSGVVFNPRTPSVVPDGKRVSHRKLG